MREPQTDIANYVAGRRAVIEALSSGAHIEKILIAYGAEGSPIVAIRAESQKKGVTCSVMDRRKFNELERSLGLAMNDSQGVIALRASKPSLTLDEILDAALASASDPLLLVLDGITDPHNLGAIARSADGAGVFGCILPSKYSAPITPVAIKASAGALETLPIAKVARVSETLKYCKQKGWNIVGTAVPATAGYTEAVYKGPTIIVIGNEGEGLHPSVQAQCDVLVEIPMCGAVSSLNASVAAGIIMYQARAQRLSLQHP
jgi:23S rRNA (guanosine2251-2'-O)-methyltransferase